MVCVTLTMSALAVFTKFSKICKQMFLVCLVCSNKNQTLSCFMLLISLVPIPLLNPRCLWINGLINDNVVGMIKNLLSSMHKCTSNLVRY